MSDPADATRTAGPGRSADGPTRLLDPSATADDPSALSPAPGSLPAVPGYEVLGVLGRGGMGVVYKARQVALNRLVAVKFLPDGPAASAGRLVRFRQEAEAVARLQHPNIVQVFEVGAAPGGAFLALEYVDGGTLQQQTAGVPQPPREAARVVETVARAVHHAHEHRIVHRDLKPGNILLTAGGVPKVADFGLARFLDAGVGLTQTTEFAGTPAYSAPEQVQNRAAAIGPATDVYALGAVLYELLAGRRPFAAGSVPEVLRAVVERDPVPPRRLVRDVPRDLETVALKCLEKEPSKRYASAAELADDLRRFLAGEPVTARPVGRVGRLARWARRHPDLAALFGLVVGLLTAVAAVAVVSAVRIDDARHQA
ncbi:MAG: serine/threonine protein kinase, partial [Gemmataceae bacterium]|nr:serine/threonine protein kinase [Gemmataceae bacterium]